MKKIKNNKIIDLKNKNEYEKNHVLGQLSKKINLIFLNRKIKRSS